MKKYYTKQLVIATLALGAVACAESDIESQTTETTSQHSDFNIGFMPTSTRATITNLEAGFLVHATSGESPTSFMISGETYKMGDSDWTWGEDTYYWPEDSSGYPMTFYGYYLADGYSVDSGDDDAQTLSVDVEVKDEGSQIDILSAYQQTSVRPVGGKLSFEFGHILTRIDLEVTASESSMVHLQSVKFLGVDDTDTYDMLTTSWSGTTTASSDSDDSAEEVDYFYLTTSNAAIKMTEQGETTAANTVSSFTPSYGSLYLMPQTLSPWDGSSTLADGRVELIFRSTTIDENDNQLGYSLASDHPDYSDTDEDGTDDDTSLSGSTPLFIRIAVPLISSDDGYIWASGSKYTYTITLGAYGTNNGYFASEYYYDEDGNETELTISNAVVGDEVTPGEICFAVTLSDWSDSSSIDLLN